MTSCLSELKVTPSFCFAFKIPDNVTATNYIAILIQLSLLKSFSNHEVVSMKIFSKNFSCLLKTAVAALMFLGKKCQQLFFAVFYDFLDDFQSFFFTQRDFDQSTFDLP